MFKRLMFPLALLTLTPLWLGCSESDPKPQMLLRVFTHVDGAAIQEAAMAYQNAAGQDYSITRLEFYLSEFTLVRDDGTTVLFDEVLYVDGLETGNLAVEPAPVAELTLESVPTGTYNGLRFTIGLAGSQNEKGQVENTINNTNMFWPDPLGGGYHYMKFEGHFASGDTTLPFTTHTGRVRVGDTEEKIEYFVSVSSSFSERHFGSGETWRLDLSMNVNEWYTEPETYVFPTPAFIMNNHQKQEILQQNGPSVMSVSGPSEITGK